MMVSRTIVGEVLAAVKVELPYSLIVHSGEVSSEVLAGICD